MQCVHPLNPYSIPYNNQAPEKFLAALAVLGAAWQSRSHFNPKNMFFLGAAKMIQNPEVRFRIQFLKLRAWKSPFLTPLKVCDRPVTNGATRSSFKNHKNSFHLLVKEGLSIHKDLEIYSYHTVLSLEEEKYIYIF